MRQVSCDPLNIMCTLWWLILVETRQQIYLYAFMAENLKQKLHTMGSLLQMFYASVYLISFLSIIRDTNRKKGFCTKTYYTKFFIAA